MSNDPFQDKYRGKERQGKMYHRGTDLSLVISLYRIDYALTYLSLYLCIGQGRHYGAILDVSSASSHIPGRGGHYRLIEGREEEEGVTIMH